MQLFVCSIHVDAFLSFLLFPEVVNRSVHAHVIIATLRVLLAVEVQIKHRRNTKIGFLVGKFGIQES